MSSCCKTRKKTLNLETMEDRRLFSVNQLMEAPVELSASEQPDAWVEVGAAGGQAQNRAGRAAQGELVIQGTAADETITVERLPGALVPAEQSNDRWCAAYRRQPDRLQVSVVDNATGETTLERSFQANRVDSLRIDAGGGDDHVIQNTDVDAIIHGGAGDDGLYSRSESELWGGEGSDRFLIAHSAENRFGTPADRTPDEVQIHLHDGQERTVHFDQFGTSVEYQAGQFSAEEVALLDEVFADLQERTGNQRILQTGRGSEAQFHRHAGGIGEDNSTPGAWNEGGQSHLTDAAFVAPMAAKQTVLHEIAHNWDDIGEHPLVDKFRDVSGWRRVTEVSAEELGSGEVTLSDDGQWVYDTDANFVLDYQRMDPHEDFAITFVGYFLIDAEHELMEQDPKLAALDELVAELTHSGVVSPALPDSVYDGDSDAQALIGCSCYWRPYPYRLTCTFSWGYCDYWYPPFSGNYCYTTNN